MRFSHLVTGIAGAAMVGSAAAAAVIPVPEQQQQNQHGGEGGGGGGLAVRAPAEMAAWLRPRLDFSSILAHVIPTGGASGMDAVKNVAECELCMLVVQQVAKALGIESSSLTGNGVKGFFKGAAEKAGLWLIFRKICQSTILGKILNKVLPGQHDPPCLEADGENETAASRRRRRWSRRGTPVAPGTLPAGPSGVPGQGQGQGQGQGAVNPGAGTGAAGNGAGTGAGTGTGTGAGTGVQGGAGTGAGTGTSPNPAAGTNAISQAYKTGLHNAVTQLLKDPTLLAQAKTGQ